MAHAVASDPAIFHSPPTNPQNFPVKSKVRPPPHSPPHSSLPTSATAKPDSARPSTSTPPNLPGPDNFQNGSDNRRFPTSSRRSQVAPPSPNRKWGLDQSDTPPFENEGTHKALLKKQPQETIQESTEPSDAPLTGVGRSRKPRRTRRPRATPAWQNIHTVPALPPKRHNPKREKPAHPASPKLGDHSAIPPRFEERDRPKAHPLIKMQAPQIHAALPPGKARFP